MLKKLIGLGIVAAFLAFTTSAAHAGACADDTDCGDTEICNADGVCEDVGGDGGDGAECASDDDCDVDGGEFCDADGTCQLDGGDGGDGAECADDVDCAGDELCVDGFCGVVDDGGGCTVSAGSASGSASAGLLALALLGLVGMARRRNRR